MRTTRRVSTARCREGSGHRSRQQLRIEVVSMGLNQFALFLVKIVAAVGIAIAGLEPSK
jgi:hypothetical protein